MLLFFVDTTQLLEMLEWLLHWFSAPLSLKSQYLKICYLKICYLRRCYREAFCKKASTLAAVGIEDCAPDSVTARAAAAVA